MLADALLADACLVLFLRHDLQSMNDVTHIQVDLSSSVNPLYKRPRRFQSSIS